jgi:hypothetical protein
VQWIHANKNEKQTASCLCGGILCPSFNKSVFFGVLPLYPCDIADREGLRFCVSLLRGDMESSNDLTDVQ